MKAAYIFNTVFFDFDQRFIQLYDYSFEKDMTISEINHLFDEPNIWTYIGHTFRQTLVNRPFIYKVSEEDSNEGYSNTLFQSSMTLEFILDLFWFAKDCSCNVYMIASYLNKRTAGLSTGNEARYNASGYKANVTFNPTDFALVNEVGQAISLLNQKSQAKHTETLKSESGISSYDRRVNYDQIEKPSKILLFLKTARTTPILPQKISNYILLLECLFSHNNQVDIVHKVSERVAFYMHKEYNDVYNAYYLVKLSYHIRSQYVHGNKVSLNHSIENPEAKTEPFKQPISLEQISVKLDELVRQILLRVYLKDSSIFFDEKGIERWLNSLMFAPFSQTPPSAAA